MIKMSFSLDVKKELSEVKIKKGCCRLSFLAGLVADADMDPDGNFKYKTTVKEVVDVVSEFVRIAARTTPVLSESINMGKPVYTLEFSSERLAKLFDHSSGEDGPIECPNCRKSFIKGLFVSYGTISEPASGYHLEFRIKNVRRAKEIYNLLCDEGIGSKIINRKNSVGLYYKNSSAIEDVLTYLGAVATLFDFMNVKIEREIRNSVNRSTNCVAGNISKTVNAARRQVSTITALGEEGYLLMLPDELFETAKLRLEYPSASLSELALAHEPPISKSGLTHRLAKIMEFAEQKGIKINN